jgi:RNA ligase (TIGR02306 family)
MMGEEEGFALRTMCFRDQISQGLLLPLSCLPADTTVEIGKDVSKLMDIKLFELPLPKELLETSIGYLPSMVVRTDQMRIQNLVSSYEEYSDLLYYISEKVDGASTSAFLADDILNIGSKDVNFKESDNIYWRTARKYNFGDILRDYRKSTGLYISIQGELVGQGLPGGSDIYDLRDTKILVYRIVNNITRRVLPYQEFNSFCNKYDLQAVPLIGIDQALPKEFNMEFFQKTSTFKSALNVKKDAEGVVYTSMDGMKSFKIISNKFLLKA